MPTPVIFQSHVTNVAKVHISQFLCLVVSFSKEGPKKIPIKKLVRTEMLSNIK